MAEKTIRMTEDRPNGGEGDKDDWKKSLNNR
jgi:hypothetical protein